MAQSFYVYSNCRAIGYHKKLLVASGIRRSHIPVNATDAILLRSRAMGRWTLRW